MFSSLVVWLIVGGIIPYFNDKIDGNSNLMELLYDEGNLYNLNGQEWVNFIDKAKQKGFALNEPLQCNKTKVKNMLEYSLNLSTHRIYGDIENKGFEFSVNWSDKIGGFKYGATVSGAFNKNKVTRIANADGILHGPSNVLSQGTGEISRGMVGLPLGYFYGFRTAGILQNQKEVDEYVGPNGQPYFPDQRPGDVRFVDQNNDGVIDEADKGYIGNPNPDYELGIQLNFEYKNVYLNTTMAGKFGMQVMQSYRSFADSPAQNYTSDVFNRWHGEGTSDKMPRLGASSNRNTQLVSDIFMQNADYLRINNLTVGYNFSEVLKDFKFISNLKFYVAVNNLYTFTKYDGMDPEVRWSGDNTNTPWASGIDLGLYPQARTVMFGLSADF